MYIRLLQIKTSLAGIVVFTVVGCSLPPTMEQCAQKESLEARSKCTESRISYNVGVAAGAGAIGGGIIGAATGAISGGPTGALYGGIVGAVGGAATGALITYYVDNHNANALADIVAANRRLDEQVAYQKIKYDNEAANAAHLSSLTEMKKSLEELKASNNELKEQFEFLLQEQTKFVNAVRYRYQTVPVQIKAKLDIRDKQISDYKQIISQQDSTIQTLEARIKEYQLRDMNPRRYSTTSPSS